MASTENRHYASCIGALSFFVQGGPKKLYIFNTPYLWNRLR